MFDSWNESSRHLGNVWCRPLSPARSIGHPKEVWIAVDSLKTFENIKNRFHGVVQLQSLTTNLLVNESFFSQIQRETQTKKTLEITNNRDKVSHPNYATLQHETVPQLHLLSEKKTNFFHNYRNRTFSIVVMRKLFCSWLLISHMDENQIVRSLLWKCQDEFNNFSFSKHDWENKISQRSFFFSLQKAFFQKSQSSLARIRWKITFKFMSQRGKWRKSLCTTWKR